ncbi:MAG: hypothetical protein ACRDBM_00855 [Sporomusa sp.]
MSDKFLNFLCNEQRIKIKGCKFSKRSLKTFTYLDRLDGISTGSPALTAAWRAG